MISSQLRAGVAAQRMVVGAGVWPLGALLLLALAGSVRGQVGTPGSNGMIPQVRATSEAVGNITTVSVVQRGPLSRLTVLGVSTTTTWLDLSHLYGPGGIFRPNLASPDAFLTPLPTGEVTFVIPESMRGRTLHLQAFVYDSGATGGIAFSALYEFRPRGLMNRSASSMPYGLMYGPAAKDPQSSDTYVFGGLSDAGFQSELLKINLGRPLGQEFTHSSDLLPSVRTMGALAVDPGRRTMYLMGGQSPNGPLDEIVVLNLSQPEGSRVSLLQDRLPSGRYGAAAVCDPRTGIIYVFGGYRNQTSLDEVVAINPQAGPGSRVQLLQDRLPTGRSYLGAAWDDAGFKAYLFGGSTAEVLEFDPSRPSGSRVQTLPDSLPTPRNFPAVTRDPRSGKIYIFGGTRGYPSLDEVVSFDPRRAAGSRVVLEDHLPATRYGSFAYYDPGLEGMVLGGGQGTVRLSDLLLYDPSRPAGQRLTSTSSLPRGVLSGTAVLDPVSGNAYLFGGFDGAHQNSITRVSARGQEFEKVQQMSDVLPVACNQATGVWDSQRGISFLFGGASTQGPLDQILSFNPAAPAGSRLTTLPDRLPRRLSGLSSVRDPVSGVIYLFGGRDPQGNTDLILSFDPSAPSGGRVSTLQDHLPAAVSLIQAIWCPTDRSAYVFGGTTSAIVRFDPSRPVGSRVSVLPDQLPSWRTMISGVFDAATETMYIFGGFVNQPSLDIVHFSPRAPVGQRVTIEGVGVLSPARYGTAAVYDPASRTTLVLGGLSTDYLSAGYMNQIWLYRQE